MSNAIINKIDEMKSAIMVSLSLVGVGYMVHPIIEPLSRMADSLELLEQRVDSLGKWTEKRFNGSDIEMVRLQERVGSNKARIDDIHNF